MLYPVERNFKHKASMRNSQLRFDFALREVKLLAL